MDSKWFSAELTCPRKHTKSITITSQLVFRHLCLHVMLPFKGQGHFWDFCSPNLLKHSRHPQHKTVQQFPHVGSVKCLFLICIYKYILQHGDIGKGMGFRQGWDKGWENLSRSCKYRSHLWMHIKGCLFGCHE